MTQLRWIPCISCGRWCHVRRSSRALWARYAVSSCAWLSNQNDIASNIEYFAMASVSEDEGSIYVFHMMIRTLQTRWIWKHFLNMPCELIYSHCMILPTPCTFYWSMHGCSDVQHAESPSRCPPLDFKIIDCSCVISCLPRFPDFKMS